MKSIQFFRALSWLIFLNLLIKPVWLFFIDRQVQNIVGYEQYGKYFGILGLSYVLFFLSDIGLSTMINQRIANNAGVNFPQLIRIKLSLLLLYLVIFLTVGWISGITYWAILFYVLAIQAFTSLLIFFRNVITAYQFYRVDAWLSVIDKSLMILVCGMMIYTSFLGGITLVRFLLIQTGCTAIAAAVAFVFILKKDLVEASPADELKIIFRQVLPFTLITLLMSLHYRVDGFLLERIHTNGAMEAGIYASAYRLLDAGNMVGYLASSFLVAFVARHVKEKEVLQDAVHNTRHVLMFCSIGVATFGWVFAGWLQQLLYHSSIGYHTQVIALCLAAFPGYCLVHVYGSVLTGAGGTREFIFLLIVSAGINLVLNLLLIPGYGAQGSCVAALVSQYFCGFASMMTATRKLTMNYHLTSILVYLLAAVLLCTFFYVGQHALLNVWGLVVIAAAVCVFLLFTQLSFSKKTFISFR